jgi:recombination protein RecA
MGRPKKEKEESEENRTEVTDENLAEILIADLNRDFGDNVAFNLDINPANTLVKYYIPTGSKILDYIISGKKNGGLPSGRIIQLYGTYSTGKTHVALECARNCQKMGGITIFIDVEQALSKEKLLTMGIDPANKFVYSDVSCLEDCFSLIEKTIIKAKNMAKDVPILIIFDSLAASSPKAELEGDYEDNTIGLAARVISKSLRKITNIIADTNATLLLLNQTRVKINATMYQSNVELPGGMAPKFFSSVMIELSASKENENKGTENQASIIGINVTAKTVKNKISAPHKVANFKIIFGKGIEDHENVWDLLEKEKSITLKNNMTIKCSGSGAWKTIAAISSDGKTLREEKFYRKDFNKLMEKQEWQENIDLALEQVMTQ